MDSKPLPLIPKGYIRVIFMFWNSGDGKLREIR